MKLLNFYGRTEDMQYRNGNMTYINARTKEQLGPVTRDINVREGEPVGNECQRRRNCHSFMLLEIG